MTDFIRVPDSERDKAPKQGASLNSPLADALRRGETLFVPLNGRTRHQIVSSAGMNVRRRGGGRVKSFVTERDGATGIVLWEEESR